MVYRCARHDVVFTPVSDFTLPDPCHSECPLAITSEDVQEYLSEVSTDTEESQEPEPEEEQQSKRRRR